MPRAFLGTWGPVIGLVGGLIGILSAILSGGLTLIDRFSPPSIDVLDLMPVSVSEPKVIAGANSAIRGVGVLLHVRGHSRPTSITGLELGGKRCVSFDEFFGTIDVQGKSIPDVENEFGRQRPFQ